MKSDCLQVAGATVFEFFLGHMVRWFGWCLEGGTLTWWRCGNRSSKEFDYTTIRGVNAL